MLNELSRTKTLLGEDAMTILKNSKVAVIGIGGVGSYAVEALARCGVGKLLLADGDSYSVTNINRQLYATQSAIGKNKAEVAQLRVLDINKNIKVKAITKFFNQDNKEEFCLENYDYVIDAIDNVTDKLCLITTAKELSVPIISSMGAGNKVDPTAFSVGDIYKTSVCPLAKIIRNKLKKLGVKSLKVVYSKEKPLKPFDYELETEKKGNFTAPGTVSFVPSVAGLILAGEVVKDLTGIKGNGLGT